ncbi:MULTISPECIES: UdgX family uracil-DNA binding protein [unclassified Microbacterium]|uniref:UdgX family uracil-DNA binding protein n=1 Tax=unclassified Microbacterium TaxID=2609290 RepID=UPI0012FCF561|nr:UdgX family uracil-DNA binding protein [Microbacterium sp. MAH-37]MVQ41526.1 UdgX family uracil-DNA binding protein [Microbacterium sp. MAH-37]
MAIEERPGAQEWVPEHGGLGALRQAAPDCRGCELWQDATQVVFSEGPARASMMLVGEQPGDQEDLEGEPFVGPAGRRLDAAIDAARLDRNGLYLTNAVKHFRFERRGRRRIHEKPAIGHIDACRPWLAAEIAVVRPDVVVAMGTTAARSVLGRNVRIGEVRGTILESADASGTPTVVTVHPSSLLRIPEEAARETAFQAFVADLRRAAEIAGGGGG